MKYQVGELVHVKKNAYEISADIRFLDEMYKYLGKDYRIEGITKTYYKLESVKAINKYINGDGYWWWSEEWLEYPTSEYDIEENEVINIFGAQ